MFKLWGSSFDGYGGDIYVQVEVWEYPEGNIEDYGVVTKGAKELEEPKFFDSGCLSEELL